MIKYACTLLAMTISLHAYAQHFVSEKHFVPLRSGPGNEFRVIHRGIPNGTRLSVEETSENGEYSRIITAGGSEGWMRSQYLTNQTPAAEVVNTLTADNTELQKELGAIGAQLQTIQKDRDTLAGKLNVTEKALASRSAELAEIKRVSANAISLDNDKRRLLEEREILRSQLEVLEAENLRLLEKRENRALINGALAVLLGVIITLLVPHLWPKRRSNSNWA